MTNKQYKQYQKPPYLGFGLGLRAEHYEYILANKPKLDWFEIVSENYMIPGGQALSTLEQIRQDYPLVMHGVSLSIGSTDPLNQDYLTKLKQLADRIQPKWISDHLCWTGINKLNMHDLLPLPYTEEAIKHVSDRVKQVQDFLGRQILLENVSSYLTYADSQITEWEFLSAIAKRADCLILLDINNIYVSSYNHGFNPMDFILGVVKDRVQQFHIAGHDNRGRYIVDTHDNIVIDEVWQLYCQALEHLGPVSTMIERDENIPEFDELYAELQVAKQLAQQTLAKVDA